MPARANTMQDATTHAQALALAGPPASVYNGGELPPVVPPVVSSVKARPRPPPPGLLQRRGLSDSGANSPAQAALSAAVAAATGGSMPVGLPPRPRPELLKSASGEATALAASPLGMGMPICAIHVERWQGPADTAMAAA